MSRQDPIAIIGAGIAGLSAARALSERGRPVVVFDKGRSCGGRASTRRVEPFSFDHGAQYFTARDPSFRATLAGWVAAGVAAPWEGRIVSLAAGSATTLGTPTARFVGTPSMSAVARHLAADLDVRSAVHVTKLERLDGTWNLLDRAGATLGAFRQLLITVPPAQAAALVGDLSPLGARAAALTMRPCWAVVLGLGKRFDVPFDGAFCEGSSLAWIARNSSKPGRPAHEAWVLHAAPAWSEAHLDVARATVAAELVVELERITCSALPPISHAEAHLWRYALPDPALDTGYLADRDLLLAGDALNGGRIEGAYLSGLAAARVLLPSA